MGPAFEKYMPSFWDIVGCLCEFPQMVRHFAPPKKESYDTHPPANLRKR